MNEQGYVIIRKLVKLGVSFDIERGHTIAWHHKGGLIEYTPKNDMISGSMASSSQVWGRVHNSVEEFITMLKYHPELLSSRIAVNSVILYTFE